ncbi:RNA methyltransferase [Odoribacter sp. OttesenSCG-928-J03]|nr:RNA methyltransferase [Odoribacter sp. OttesenSCG-928-J03]MDL2283205.1 RNA methyltransferase [Odoribacter sp. OttesenSCG-928-G04]
MNKFPSLFCERMKEELQEEYDSFIHSLNACSPTSIRFNPGKPADCGSMDEYPLFQSRVEWSKYAIYLKERPVFTLDPIFQGGGYYVQEASSMFLEHILTQLPLDRPLRVLDLCAAPGGKSTLLASVLPQDSLLVSNEVISSRAAILKENIIKWGHDNIVVSNSDPSRFSKIKEAFDIIIVDAPCSGEGMFRKDPKAISEWSENNLQLCSSRQKRILSDIWESLKPEGFLIYSTCTYNKGENEEIIKWLTENFDAESISIDHAYPPIVSIDSPIHAYQFYPHKIGGEGFFVGVVQKKGGSIYPTKREKSKIKSSRTLQLPEEVKKMIDPESDYYTYIYKNIYGIIPAMHADFVSELESGLNVLYKGCELIELNHQKIKPLHPMALYRHLNKKNCHLYDADRETALKYLKKEEIPVQGESGEWVLVTYNNIGLGWCKNIGNRMNNYFPKELRIRMEIL